MQVSDVVLADIGVAMGISITVIGGLVGVACVLALGWRARSSREYVPILEGVRGVPDRGALAGAMIAAVFGVAWTEWAASGISGAPSGTIRVAGIAVGLTIVLWSSRLWLSAHGGKESGSTARRQERPGSFFLSRAFWLVTALEVVAIRGGTGLLGATGHAEYAVAWVAAAVGMHFLAFGRLFWAGFYWVGAALIAAGMAGAMVGVAGGGSDGIPATTGLMAAASLFLASGWSVLQATGQQRHLTETVSRS